MKNTFKTFALCAAAAAMLAACGGGSSDSPDATDLNSSLTVTNATNASLNGIYASTATGISDVNKIQGNPDKCDFSYNNLKKATDANVAVNGNVQYTEGATTLGNTSINIAGAGYASELGENTSVNRAANRIEYTGKVFTLPGGTATITVTGFIPMKGNRPSGC